MSLATLNNNYFIPTNVIQQSRPNYQILVTNKINQLLSNWMKSRSYINLNNKAQKISDADMKALSDMIQQENNQWVQLSIRLSSEVLMSYYKGNNTAIANAVRTGGADKYKWQGYTMMQLLTESQILIDAAGRINSMLVGKTTYRVG